MKLFILILLLLSAPARAQVDNVSLLENELRNAEVLLGRLRANPDANPARLRILEENVRVRREQLAAVRPAGNFGVYFDPVTGKLYSVFGRSYSRIDVDGPQDNAIIRNIDKDEVGKRLVPLKGAEVFTRSGGRARVLEVQPDPDGGYSVRYESLDKDFEGTTRLSRIAPQTQGLDGLGTVVPGARVKLRDGGVAAVKRIFADGTIETADGRIVHAARDLAGVEQTEIYDGVRGKFRLRPSSALFAAGDVLGFLASASEDKLAELVAAGKCPAEGGLAANSKPAFVELSRAGAGLWPRFFEACRLKGKTVDFSGLVRELAATRKYGVASAQCLADGRVRVVHQSGMTSEFSFGGEKNLKSLKTFPSAAPEDFAFQYENGGRAWELKTSKAGKPFRGETWPGFMQRLACAQQTCTSSELSVIRPVDESLSAANPFGDLNVDYEKAVAAGKTLLLARQLALASGDAGQSAYSGLCKGLNAKVPDDLRFPGAEEKPAPVILTGGVPSER